MWSPFAALPWGKRGCARLSTSSWQIFRVMPELAEVFTRHGDGYLAKHGRSILPSHRRAIRDIVSCRTDVMGGHVFRCDSCGREVYAYHSCRNRNCPKCRHKIAEDWLEARRRELLPVTHFHAVFTLPSDLRRTGARSIPHPPCAGRFPGPQSHVKSRRSG